ncbi:unnamed protein product, partial [Meganyctiphanes norvegica]
YRPVKQHDICVNYDTSPLDVHIINPESKIASADYKVYLTQTVPLVITLLVIGFPVIILLVLSFRTVRKVHTYRRDHSVKQVKSALQLTQKHSLSRQASASSIAITAISHIHGIQPAQLNHKLRTHKRHPYKLKYTFSKKNKGITCEGGSQVSEDLESNGNYIPTPASSGCPTPTPLCHLTDTCRDQASSNLECRNITTELTSPGRIREPLVGKRHHHQESVTTTVRKLRGLTGQGRERDREITRTVLVNIFVFAVALFPMLSVGMWMLYLYFTNQVRLNTPAPLKQLLFLAPWLMALNSVSNSVLHLVYNHKFRRTAHLLFSSICSRCMPRCMQDSDKEEPET